MRKDREVNDSLSPEYRKEVNVAAYLYSAFALTNGIICVSATDNVFVRVGELYLWIPVVMFLVEILIVPDLVRRYIKKLRFIKVYLIRYTVILIVCVGLFALHGFMCSYNIRDIVTGAREVTTNEYRVYFNNFRIVFTDPEGETRALKITGPMAEEFGNTPHKGVSENGLDLYDKEINIKYYEYTGIIKEIK